MLKPNWGEVTGGMHDEDIAQLIVLLQSLKPAPLLIGELGCWTGRATRALAEAAGPHATVVSVDWFRGSPGIATGTWAEKNDILALWRTNTADLKNVVCVIAESAHAAAVLAHGQFDLFFIDADHRYAAVRRDLSLWERAVRRGGLLCGHDFERPASECTPSQLAQETTDYIDSPPTHPGVIRAVSERYGTRVRHGNRLWWVEIGT